MFLKPNCIFATSTCNICIYYYYYITVLIYVSMKDYTISFFSSYLLKVFLKLNFVLLYNLIPFFSDILRETLKKLITVCNYILCFMLSQLFYRRFFILPVVI